MRDLLPEPLTTMSASFDRRPMATIRQPFDHPSYPRVYCRIYTRFDDSSSYGTRQMQMGTFTWQETVSHNSKTDDVDDSWSESDGLCLRHGFNSSSISNTSSTRIYAAVQVIVTV